MTNLLGARYLSLVSALSRHKSLSVLLFLLLGEEESKEIPPEIQGTCGIQSGLGAVFSP